MNNQLLESFLNLVVLSEIEDQSEYEEEISYALAEIKTIFPNVTLQSTSELVSFLKESIPVMVLTKLYNCGSLKVCSGISPAFTEVACAYGFPTLTVSVPGHFFNLVITANGLVKIDLSAIQFTRKTVYDNEEGEKEVEEILSKVLHNPFSAVEIKMLGKKNTELLHRGRAPRGTGAHDKFFDPIQDFERGKQRVGRILSDRENYKKSKSQDVYRDADFGVGLDSSVLDKLK